MGKVLILGAGASYGHGVENTFQPPLASGFFDHPQSAQLLDDYSELFRYIDEVLGLDLSDKDDAEIENLFGHLESTWRIGIHDEEDPEWLRNRFGGAFAWVDPVQMMQSYMVDLLLLSTDWLSNNTCPYHDYLAEKWLNNGDSIVSFNYDLVMDFSVSKRGDWHPSSGYGWIAEIIGEDYSNDRSEVKLFKLHGSLNWFKGKKFGDFSYDLYDQSSNRKAQPESKDDIKLVKLASTMAGKTPNLDGGDIPPKRGLQFARASEMFYDKTRDSDDFLSMFLTSSLRDHDNDLQRRGYLPLMILPTPYKPFSELRYGQIKAVWRQAKEAIQEADELLACGFSFRDSHFNQMVRECAHGKSKPLKIKIATKDEEVIKHVNKSYRKANVDIEYIDAWLDGLVAKLGY